MPKTPDQARSVAEVLDGFTAKKDYADFTSVSKTLRSLASQVEQLEAELANAGLPELAMCPACFVEVPMDNCDAITRDAKRYRWLRLNAYVDVMKSLPRIEGVQTMMFDNTIDAAIAKGAA